MKVAKVQCPGMLLVFFAQPVVGIQSAMGLRVIIYPPKCPVETLLGGQKCVVSAEFFWN